MRLTLFLFLALFAAIPAHAVGPLGPGCKDAPDCGDTEPAPPAPPARDIQELLHDYVKCGVAVWL